MFSKSNILQFIVAIFTTTLYAETHHPQEFLTQIKGSTTEAQQIYEHFCANCHALKPIIPLGAPKIGVKTDWDVRSKQGISILFKHVNEGLNAMPPRGGCFECTDDQLMLTLVEMMPEEYKKDLLKELKDYKINKK